MLRKVCFLFVCFVFTIFNNKIYLGQTDKQTGKKKKNKGLFEYPCQKGLILRIGDGEFAKSHSGSHTLRGLIILGDVGSSGLI